MIYHHPIEKDNYITNKIIMNVRRATDANVGQASTLDLFKLWNENLCKGETGDIIEVSNLLLQSDLADLKTKLDAMIDTDVASLKIRLVLKDVQGTQVSPQNFSIDLLQQDQAWNEGNGSDIAAFKELDASNWTQASADTEWENAGGIPTAETVLGTQHFDQGNEDLSIDITTWVREVWAGNVTNNGWLLKLSDAMLSDEYSYFVKRFSSRHSRNPYQRPLLVVTWDDFHQDDRLQFETSTTNVLSVKHYIKGSLAPLDNVTSNLSYGDWSLSPTPISNVTIGGVEQPGWFEATYRGIEIYGADSDLQADLLANGEIDLTETWYSNGEIWFQTTVKLKRNLITTEEKARDYRISLMEMKEKYTHDETPVVRLFVRDKRLDNEPVRRPIELPSQRLESAWFRIKDYGNRTEPVVDFSYPENWTRLSSDGTGMYFTLPTQILPSGRTFSIDIMYTDRGKKYVWESKTAFRVEGE